MSWFRSEVTRIAEETGEWRESALHHRYGGWLGVFFTVVALAGSGWVDMTTLERVFHLAVTPLAVLWGFQHIADRDRASSSGRLDRAWERRSQVTGILAVVFIFFLTAIPDGSVKRWLATLTILLIADAIGAATTRVPDRSRPLVGRAEAAGTGGETLESYGWATIIDIVTVGIGLWGIHLVARGWTTEGAFEPLLSLLQERWLAFSWPCFLLYEWFTVAKWGCRRSLKFPTLDQ